MPRSVTLAHRIRRHLKKRSYSALELSDAIIIEMCDRIPETVVSGREKHGKMIADEFLQMLEKGEIRIGKDLKYELTGMH
jgi:hypothetical protein